MIGAGTMGGGIAMNFLNAGIPVTLVEMNQAALDRGVGVIRKNYESTAAKGRMTAEQVEQRMGLITPALGLEALAEVDLVIEAVFEQMGVKKDIFGKLDGICKQGAILASNTSFLNIDEIASATQRPEWVFGLHFFSPANVMRLLEVVRGAKTSMEVDRHRDEARQEDRQGAGAEPRLPRLHRQPGDGAAHAGRPSAGAGGADAAGRSTRRCTITASPMGPFQMIDLVGLDVIGRESSERTLHGRSGRARSARPEEEWRLLRL